MNAFYRVTFIVMVALCVFVALRERGRITAARAAGYAAAAETTIDTLGDLAEHDRGCIRSEFNAGRPTPNGGYECCFGRAWYESRPVDRTPPCACGLAAALDKWRAGR